ncbi:MAG: tetratricopeptide repeat protein, partial [Gemmataceae bacterium]|nr:tetratricopeptide repeat protein [Gemmataceae bacterium]
VLLLAAGGGAFAWWEDNRAGARRVEEAVAEARARQAVESAIALAADLREKFRFAQARAALDHAAGTIPPGAPSDIRDRLDRARDDLELVRELDTIRASRVTNPNWRPYPELTAEYRAVFRGRGVDPAEDDPVVTAGRVAASPVRHHLVVALDDWAWLESNPETRGRLLAATRRADPDPWLDRVRDPAAWDDEAVMNRLAAEIDAAAPPPHHVVLICQVVGKTWARGADLLEAAAARHPDDFWVQFEAGYYWAVKDPQPARAMQHLQAALALRPDNPNAMMLMRGLLRKAGDTAGADRWLRAAAGVSGTDARRLVLLGRTLREEGDPDRETEFYRRAIADFPQSADGYNGMGIALAAKGDLDGAIAYYREGIRVDPTNARPFNNLGYALLNKGDLAGSEAALREAVRLDPRLTVALLNLGKLLHRKGDLDGAAAAVRGAIRLDPKGKSPRYRLSELLSAQGDRAGVVECFRDAVRHNPNAAWAHIELGVALANAGDPAGAEACYREAIKLDPKDPDGPNNLAWLLAVGPDGFRDGREAVRLATRACELTGFADANDLDTLAAAHAEAGDFGKAVEVQNRALALPGAEEQYGAEFHERLGLYERGRPYRNPAFVPRPVAPPPREVTR